MLWGEPFSSLVLWEGLICLDHSVGGEVTLDVRCSECEKRGSCWDRKLGEVREQVPFQMQAWKPPVVSQRRAERCRARQGC